jgi:hypothetical protein
LGEAQWASVLRKSLTFARRVEGPDCIEGEGFPRRRRDGGAQPEAARFVT